MALPVVLSAMKEILLSLGDLPLDPVERRELLKRSFPDLTETELEDLARIPPEGFPHYSKKQLSGEAQLLEGLFPVTFAALHACWKSTYGEDFKVIDFATVMNAAYPWESYTTESLVGNFLNFLSVDLVDLHSRARWIPELATLEHTISLLRSLPDEESGNTPLVHLSDIPQLKVSELLDLQFTISSPVRLIRCNWGVLRLLEEFHASGGKLGEPPAHTPMCIAAGRDRKGESQWNEIPGAVYELLARTPPGRWVSVTNLAEAVIASLPADTGEEVAFDAFLEILISLLRGGVIVTMRPE